MVWIRDGEKSLMICLAVWTQYRRVTVFQIDGHSAIRDRPKSGFAFWAENETNAESLSLFSARNRNENESFMSFSAEDENETNMQDADEV